MGNAVVLLCFVALAVVGALVIIFALLSSLPLFTEALTPIITDSTNNTVKGPEQVYSIYNQIPLAACGIRRFDCSHVRRGAMVPRTRIKKK